MATTSSITVSVEVDLLFQRLVATAAELLIVHGLSDQLRPFARWLRTTTPEMVRVSRGRMVARMRPFTELTLREVIALAASRRADRRERILDVLSGRTYGA